MAVSADFRKLFLTKSLLFNFLIFLLEILIFHISSDSSLGLNQAQNVLQMRESA